MTTSVTFTSSSSFSVGNVPRSVAVGDFNKDGILDIVTSNLNGNNVSVLLGNGSGGFNAASSSPFSVRTSPFSVAVADFNKDGKLDIVTANGGSNNVSVLLGNGSGGFNAASSSPFSVGTSPYSVAVGDFNKDGILDIVTANVNGNNVSVLLGNGSGGFNTASPSPFSVGNNPVSVAVGDFNKDGILDIVTANLNGNNVSVLLGNGSGGFNTASSSPFSVGNTPFSVAVGDFNKDGILDIVTANGGSNDVSVLLGDGSGGFNAASSSPFSVGNTPVSVAVGDFNKDGKLDIVTANLNDGNVSVLLNETPIPTTGGGGDFTNPNDDIFQIGGDEFTKVNIKIKIKGRSTALINELGVFNVDDNEGKIDGIAPGAAGYQEKALARAKTIFSVLNKNPTGFTPENLSRILEFNGGTQLRFYLKSQGSIIFSSTTTQQITSLSEGGFSIGWKDGSRSNSIFDDLQITVQETDEDLPIGIGLQGKSQGEAIDLRDYDDDSLIAGTFTIYREATYNNYVGFYKVVDESGGIDTNGDGTADVLVGDAGYLQAAINQRVTGIGLSVGNQGTGNSQANFTGGGIYVPFLVINGGIDALLDSNTSNDPTVFFTFLGANSDKTQHVRLLGDNTFGFEDLVGGGDNDFNDVIVKINLTAPAQNF